MSKEIENKIDDALYQYYLNADHDIIQESLNEDIKDLAEYQKKKKRIIFLINATVKKQHNDNLLQLVDKFQQALLQNIEKPIAIFKSLIQGDSSFALHKNLDKLSKEEIIEILKDKNLVELLEQLDGHDPKY
jgi:phosphate starvation-inducible protein PhoH